MIDLVVIGAGGFGRETLDVIEAINGVHETYRVVGMVDDAPSPVFLERLTVRGYRHLGSIDEWLASGDGERFVVGVGTPAVRAAMVARIGEHATAATALIHPTASIGSQFVAGEGTVVCAHATISTNVRLGAHVHVNPAAVIGHDSTCADYVSLNPGATVSGEVEIGFRALIGAKAVILQGLRVGPDATLAASACLTKNAPSAATLVGIPARAPRSPSG